MNANEKVVVIGLGEIGKPLVQLISRHYQVVAVDISPVESIDGGVDVMHVCYPFQIQDFVGETARYIRHFRPSLTIINSTVAVGTTRAVAESTGSQVVNSPVRGKHVHMLQDLQRYTKFVGASDHETGERAAKHLESVGLKTRVLASPEATELAKLTETTYFGVMIAWAQEVERYCDQSGQNYEDVVSFYDEIEFFPSQKYFPGVIGGHCVMPNIEILRAFSDSVMLDAVRASNRMKIERGARKEFGVIVNSARSAEQIAV